MFNNLIAPSSDPYWQNVLGIQKYEQIRHAADEMRNHLRNVLMSEAAAQHHALKQEHRAYSARFGDSA